MCLLSQLSSLSIEDQEDTPFPYAMRDLPPIYQPGDQHQKPDRQAPVHREAEGTGTAANGLHESPTRPRACLCNPTGSSTVPHRPSRVGSNADFQLLPLRRQRISQVSMDCPLSPASRPHSPWGRFDPYDSAEVCFCVPEPVLEEAPKLHNFCFKYGCPLLMD